LIWTIAGASDAEDVEVEEGPAGRFDRSFIQPGYRAASDLSPTTPQKLMLSYSDQYRIGIKFTFPCQIDPAVDAAWNRPVTLGSMASIPSACETLAPLLGVESSAIERYFRSLAWRGALPDRPETGVVKHVSGAALGALALALADAPGKASTTAALLGRLAFIPEREGQVPRFGLGANLAGVVFALVLRWDDGFPFIGLDICLSPPCARVRWAAADGRERTDFYGCRLDPHRPFTRWMVLGRGLFITLHVLAAEAEAALGAMRAAEARRHARLRDGDIPALEKEMIN
jgi:hypothetical protein